MESVRSTKLKIGIFVIQVLLCGIGISQPCSPGFGSDLYLFGVPRETLQKGTKIGTILFNDCSGRAHTDFMSTDTQYHVDPDGTVKLKSQITLNNGHNMFAVHAWDSKGRKHTVLVRVEHDRHGQQEDVEQTESALTDSSSAVLVLEFPYSGGLRRRKREWIVPPIRILENEHGPFPSKLVKIKSSYGKETTMEYKITGEGANEDPVGIFTIDKITGWLYVSKPLDREDKAEYKLQAHAYSPVDESIKEDSMDVIVQVLDQNDNTPVFTQNPFIGSVPESSKKGIQFMTVYATDADAPNSDNSDIRYSIISQLPEEPSPNMFAINPITGEIQVNDEGLDGEIYPQYTLEIQAADLKGEGRPVIGRAIIKLKHNKSSKELKPLIRIPENERGVFPKEIVQIKSNHAKKTEVRYSISGSGANLSPMGLFLMDKHNGRLYVARPLDRERKEEYVLQVHAFGDNIDDEHVEFIIHVVDQNDNKPVFTQDPFLCSVIDTSKIGMEILTISASDADEPNTDNTDIRYSIISQDPPQPSPNMFAIDSISGVIRVNAEGLNAGKYPQYALKIQAADMQGNGLSSGANVVVFVKDIKDVQRTPPYGTWDISPIYFPENARGPYPHQLVQIKSSLATQSKMAITVSGEGADQPPVGLFTVNKDTGWLSVTKPLDRETKDKYVLQIRVSGGGGGLTEHPTEITIRVIDQNDNKPVFIRDQFSGSVPEGAKIGSEFMTIIANDLDDPNTDNAEIRYSIISQHPALPQPNMFEINPISGVIQVKAEGLDKEKYPKYDLEIQAADMQGNGLQSRAKAVITVTA